MSQTIRRTKSRGAVGTRGVARAAAVCALLALCVGVQAWTRVEGTLVGYALSEAQSEQAELLREQKALSLELDSRRATVRIEVDARKKLGMIEPGPERIIPLDAGPAKAPAMVQARAP